MKAESSCVASTNTLEKASRSQGMTPNKSFSGNGPVPPMPPWGRKVGLTPGSSTPNAFRSLVGNGTVVPGAKAAACGGRPAAL